MGPTRTGQRGGGAFRGTGHEGGKPRTIRVLHRGDMSQPRDEVGPGTLRLATRDDGTFDLSGDHAESDRRVALAHWLTKTDNPLTWRSIVNRVWQYHFGNGIVATPNDFGEMGARPTHPQLLDWLAAELRDNRQSIKQLHRIIMNTAAYQLEAGVGLEQKLYGSFQPRRLSAEELRDTLLSLGQTLDYSTPAGHPFLATRNLDVDLPPATVDATGFHTIGFDWQPCGHPPLGVFTVPHYDIHFYLS